MLCIPLCEMSSASEEVQDFELHPKDGLHFDSIWRSHDGAVLPSEVIPTPSSQLNLAA